METTDTFLHQEIYESLENWALHNGVADDQMVVGLLEDLRNEENQSSELIY